MKIFILIVVAIWIPLSLLVFPYIAFNVFGWGLPVPIFVAFTSLASGVFGLVYATTYNP